MEKKERVKEGKWVSTKSEILEGEEEELEREREREREAVMRERISTRKVREERVRSDRVTEQKEDRKWGGKAEKQKRRRAERRQMTGKVLECPPQAC